MQLLALYCISEVHDVIDSDFSMDDILKRGRDLLPNIEPWYDEYVEIFSRLNEVYDFEKPEGNYFVKSLKLKGVRRYPNDSYYGLQFPIEGKKDPVGMVILGNNGSGKSSLYSSMEYYCTDTVGEASLRNVPPISYFGEKKPDIEVDAVRPLKDIVGKLPLNTFFCSEYNLIEMAKQFQGTNSQDYYKPYVELMGLGEVYTLINRLRSFEFEDVALSVDRRIFNELTDFFSSNHKDLEGTALLDLLTGKDTKTGRFTQDDAHKLCMQIARIVPVDEIRKEARQLQNRFRRIKQNELMIEIPDAAEMRPHFEAFEALVGYMRKVYESYLNHQSGATARRETIMPHFPFRENNEGKSYIAQELNEKKKLFANKLEDNLISQAKEFVDGDFVSIVKSILYEGRFLDREREEVVFNVGDYIEVGIKIPEKEDIIPPTVYFNTFRLRLFCLCVRMAAACKLMNEHNFAFPIVYDDIFYSSDYENRELLKQFFFQLHNHYYVYACKRDSHPQLIFFTHDEQIFSVVESVYRDEKTEEANIAFGRLIDYRTADTTFEFAGDQVKDLCTRYDE